MTSAQYPKQKCTFLSTSNRVASVLWPNEGVPQWHHHPIGNSNGCNQNNHASKYHPNVWELNACAMLKSCMIISNRCLQLTQSWYIPKLTLLYWLSAPITPVVLVLSHIASFWNRGLPEAPVAPPLPEKGEYWQDIFKLLWKFQYTAMTRARSVFWNEPWYLNIRRSVSNLVQNIYTLVPAALTLQWRHYERDCVLNHQRLDCLLNRLFRRWQIKENIKAPCHWPLWGWPVNSPHKGPITHFFHFDDIIMNK